MVSFGLVSSRSFRKGLQKCLLLLAQAKQEPCKLVYRSTHLQILLGAVCGTGQREGHEEEKTRTKALQRETDLCAAAPPPCGQGHTLPRMENQSAKATSDEEGRVLLCLGKAPQGK